MAELVNALSTDVYNTVNMTEAINKLPVVPTMIGDMGLFKQVGSPTVGIQIEEKRGVLALVNSQLRGTVGRQNTRSTRVTSSVYNCVHLPVRDTILAEACQGIRAFGTTDVLESPTDVVSQRILDMKQNIDVTLEWQRAGALRGVVLDGDGTTTIYNWFTEFGITEQVQDFAFTTSTTDVKQLALNVIRLIGDALGQTPFTKVIALCSDGFYDSLIAHPVVKAAHDVQQSPDFFRGQQGAGGQGSIKGFEFGNITWYNYRGVVGSSYMIPANTCRFVPVGAPQLFMQYFGPADYIEAVNTMGKPYYAKRIVMPFDKGWELEAQSNPLTICTRPKCLIKGTKS